MPFLYLIAIAWIYVVMLMALTENSIVAGVLTFLFYCVVPLFIVFYLALSPSRKRQRLSQIKPTPNQSNSDNDAPPPTVTSGDLEKKHSID